MTSVDVNDADSIRTLNAALDAGINFFDTAYGYGANGESERLIGTVIKDKREQVVIATKCGLAWDERGERVIDGRPATLKRQIDESLSRLELDEVEVLYLHAPDPTIDVTDSAGALREILEAGKTRTVGVSNFSMSQLIRFHDVCPITVVQPPYNLLQREIEKDIVPWCIENGVSLATYWPLMKGLLAGKLARDHVFQPGDGRAKYPMFQGEEWLRNQDFVDDLREIAESSEKTVAQIVVRWTLQQPGITSALCGAKRAYQIEETAHALEFELTDSQLNRIEAALVRRGAPTARGAV
jgi:aryl-alcohol dehydrogenase-like predicted oxidoreductase